MKRPSRPDGFFSGSPGSRSRLPGESGDRRDRSRLPQEEFPPPRPSQAGERPPPKERRTLSHVGGVAQRQGQEEGSRFLASVLEGVENVAPFTLTHGFHSWPGRMHPEIARRILGGSPAVERARPYRHPRVVDPFCGSGTVLVEAMVAGAEARGFDINPVGRLVARARTRLLSSSQREELLAMGKAIAEEVFAAARAKESIPLPSAARREASWYGPHVLLELTGLIRRVDDVLDLTLRDLLRAVFSSIVVKVSNQPGDSSGRIVRRQVGRGTAATLFGRKVEELVSQLAELKNAVKDGVPVAEVLNGDAREMPGLTSGSVDLFITSPPYPGTFTYIDHQARRLPWLGFGRSGQEARQGEIGARHDQGPGSWNRFHLDMLGWMSRAADALTPHGEMFILIGDGVLEGRPWHADEEMARLAPQAGLVPIAAASQERPHFHRDSQKAFQGEPRQEHLVLLQKRG